LRRTLAPAAVAFIVVAAPMLAVAATEPLNYFGRAAATSFANPEVQADASFPVHVLRTLGMFGFLGDPNARHDVAGLPLLPLPLVALAALGVWRLWRERSDPASSLILLALPVFLAAPLIATEGGSPHFLRALGLAAPLGVTIGLGTVELAERVRGRWGLAPARAAAGLAAAALAAVAATSGWAYLTRPPAERYDAFSYDVAAAAQLAQTPGSAIVIYDFAAYDVGFLDYYAMPTLVAPGSPIDDPSAYSQILALTREDLVAALGPELAARARPVAWDPAGKVRVWAASMHSAGAQPRIRPRTLQ